MKIENLKIESGYASQQRKGGQSVGAPCPSVRVTHIPTGLIAVCECERSQLKNKNVCLAMIEYGLAELGWREG